MINFEAEKSEFYELNKAFCESIDSNLKSVNASLKGYCNSFGYEIESDFELNNLHLNLKLFKNQTTQNGVIIPKDAVDQSGTQIHVNGLNKNQFIKIGQSVLKRIFTTSENKINFPKPYYINHNEAISAEVIKLLAGFILNHKISKLVLFNGTLHIEMHYALKDPVGFVNEMLELMSEID
jgi:hypothetical protein